MKQYKTGIFIFRRDFRLNYNTAFAKCLERCEKIIPVFIFTPSQTGDSNTYRSTNAIQFMIESLDDLNSQIKQKGGKLYTL